jgi:hypothetical protein
MDMEIVKKQDEEDKLERNTFRARLNGLTSLLRLLY